MEALNFLYGLLLTEKFGENWFQIDNVAMVMSRPIWEKMTSFFQEVAGGSNLAQRFVF